MMMMLFPVLRAQLQAGCRHSTKQKARTILTQYRHEINHTSIAVAISRVIGGPLRPTSFPTLEAVLLVLPTALLPQPAATLLVAAADPPLVVLAVVLLRAANLTDRLLDAAAPPLDQAAVAFLLDGPVALADRLLAATATAATAATAAAVGLGFGFGCGAYEHAVVLTAAAEQEQRCAENEEETMEDPHPLLLFKKISISPARERNEMKRKVTANRGWC